MADSVDGRTAPSRISFQLSINLSGSYIRNVPNSSLARKLPLRILAEYGHLCAFCTIHVVILKEDIMKSSIRDTAEGAFHELKGTAREIAGRLNEDPDLEAKGIDEKIAGKVQEKLGQIKKVLGK